MRTWHFIAVICLAALISGSIPVLADEFTLPDPPVYKPVKDEKALITLRNLKVEWLEKKKKAEDKWIEHLKREQKQEGADKESYDKEITNYQKMSDQDKEDRDDLKKDDAFDTEHNSKSDENAKLIKTNVEKWIATLDQKRAAAVLKSDNNEIQRIDADKKALSDALSQAQKDSPWLFRPH